MANNFTDEQNKFLSQSFTLKGRAFHPNLLTAKAKSKDNLREVFDVQFAWLKHDNQQAYAQIMQYL